MFKWLNKQGVESDSGFAVQSMDRSTVEYREGGRKISVEVERGFEGGVKPCVIIEPVAFQRWDGQSEDLPISRQQEVLSNFRAAMEFQGIAVVVERRFS